MIDMSTLQVSIDDSPRNEEWDRFVAATPGGDHLQSSGWGEVKRAQGWEPVRVLVGEDEHVAGVQMLTKRIPLLGRLAYVPRGPVISGRSDQLALFVVNELTRVASRLRVRHLLIQPPRGGDWIAGILPACGFARSRVNVAPTATLLIDLTQDLDDITAAMTKSVRRNIRRAERRGVSVREGDQADLRTMVELSRLAGERHGFDAMSLGNLNAIWRGLSHGDHVKLFIAEVEGQPVTGHLTVPFGETFLTKLVAWSGEASKAHPNEAVEWHMIRWAREHGFRRYDMEGFDRHQAETLSAGGEVPPEEMRGADAFKLGFGGDVTVLPETFEWFPNASWRLTYGSAYKAAVSKKGWPRPGLRRLLLRT